MILLAGGSVGALLVVGGAAGCTSGGGTPSPAPTPTRATPPPDNSDNDLALRRRVAGEVLALRAAYTAVIGAQSTLRRTVAGLAAEHDAHARALDPGATLPSPVASSASMRSASPASATSRVSPVVTLASRPDALRWLAGLERAAATRRTADVLVAGRDLARLLASIAACETTHALLLEAVA